MGDPPLTTQAETPKKNIDNNNTVIQRWQIIGHLLSFFIIGLAPKKEHLIENIK